MTAPPAAAVAALEQAFETVPVDTLELHPANPRRGDLDRIAASISENGFYGALVVQRSTRRVLVGNHRLRAAQLHGLAELPVLFIDVDDAKATDILLADNHTNDAATYDPRALAELLAGYSPEALRATTYTTDEVADALRVSGLLAEQQTAFLGQSTGQQLGTLIEGEPLELPEPAPRQLVFPTAEDERAEILDLLRAAQRRLGTATLTQTLLAVLRRDAQAAQAGEAEPAPAPRARRAAAAGASR